MYVYIVYASRMSLKKEENKKGEGKSKDYVSRVVCIRRLIYDGPKVYDRLSCD